MGLAQGLFDLAGRIPAREDESQITAAFPQRRQLLAGRGGDEDLEDSRNFSGLLQALHVFVDTGPRNRNHHDA
jgi:hypothetical protein